MVADLRIDYDAVVYIAGHAADSRGGELRHSLHNAKLVTMSIINRFAPCHVEGYLTSKDPKANFRNEIFPQYKKNRSRCPACKSNNLISLDRFGSNELGGRWTLKACGDCGKDDIRGTKPIYYNEIRAYLINKFGAKICKWGEADDWLGANPTPETIIASHDKDLLMIPAKHWRLRKNVGFLVKDPGILKYDKGELKGTGKLWFVSQLLLGDTVDNIPVGVPQFGPQKIFKLIGSDKDPIVAYSKAKEKYLSHPGNTEDMWLIRCKLMWISRLSRQIFSEEMFLNT